MGKIKTSDEVISKIINLRKKGLSISEISKNTGKSKSIVSKYIQDVFVPEKYLKILKEKQGGSKYRSNNLWTASNLEAENIIKTFSDRDKLILLIGIYWGEGTKRELNIINSDPVLLRAFVDFSEQIGVSKNRIKASVRVYNNMDKYYCINYWSKVLNINKNQFFNTEVINGKKNGKLKYGMCRLRVEKSSKEFKLLISLINVVKNHILPS